MFRHPKYYKNLRKLARNRDPHVRPISGSVDSATDQAISLTLTDGCNGSVRPGPGLQVTSHKLPGPRPISNANKGLIHRRQAPSVKLSNQPVQATSDKRQAQRHKLQAPSHKQQAHWSLNHGKVSSTLNRGAQCRWRYCLDVSHERQFDVDWSVPCYPKWLLTLLWKSSQNYYSPIDQEYRIS